TLLWHEPRDDSDDGPVGLFGQTEAAQQIESAFTLSGHVFSGKMRRDMRVCFGVPDFVIDSVGDAYQPIAARAHQPIKSITMLRRLNFARITRADGRQKVGGDNSSLQSRSRAFQH